VKLNASASVSRIGGRGKLCQMDPPPHPLLALFVPPNSATTIQTLPTAIWASMTQSDVQVVRVDASASVSRIGGRAYPPALRDLAQSARLELVQAQDAARFSSSLEDPATSAALARAERLTIALTQPPGHPVPLEEQVRGTNYSTHALKRSVIKRSIAIKRSAKPASQLLFPTQILTFKRRIAVGGAWNRKLRHSA